MAASDIGNDDLLGLLVEVFDRVAPCSSTEEVLPQPSPLPTASTNQHALDLDWVNAFAQRSIAQQSAMKHGAIHQQLDKIRKEKIDDERDSANHVLFVGHFWCVLLVLLRVMRGLTAWGNCLVVFHVWCALPYVCLCVLVLLMSSCMPNAIFVKCVCVLSESHVRRKYVCMYVCM